MSAHTRPRRGFPAWAAMCAPPWLGRHLPHARAVQIVPHARAVRIVPHARTARILLVALLLWAGGLAASAKSADPVSSASAEDLRESLRQWRESSGALSPAESENLAEQAERIIAGGAGGELLLGVLWEAREGDLAAEDLQAILTRAARLAEQDLPADPMLDRFLQGMAKGIAFPRIVGVADETISRLVEAGRLLTESYPAEAAALMAAAAVQEEAVQEETTTAAALRSARHAMIGHLAYALGAGAGQAELSHGLRLAAGEDLPLADARAPVLALGCLAGAGLQSEEAQRIVDLSWRHGYRGPWLERLAEGLAALAGSGADATETTVDEVLQQITRGGERKRLLEQLENLRRREWRQGPGMGPGSDPSHTQGPGGPPDNPGQQGSHGHGGPPDDAPGPR